MNKTDVPPSIPPEVAAKQKLGRALTAETRELLGYDKTMDQADVIAQERFQAVSSQQRQAMSRAEEWAGPTPLRGLTPEQINAVREMEIPGMPPMGVKGDRTPAYVNAIWAKLPRIAAIRYYGRVGDIYPTELPKNWPPADTGESLIPAVGVSTTLAAQPAGATFTAEQVKDMIQGAINSTVTAMSRPAGGVWVEPNLAPTPVPVVADPIPKGTLAELEGKIVTPINPYAARTAKAAATRAANKAAKGQP